VNAVRVLVHDFSGHPFQVQLSRELAARGHEVTHVDCASFTTPKGNLAVGGDRLTIRSIDLGRRFDKYSPARRLRQELEYGRRFVSLAREVAPDVVIASNDPLLAKWVAARWFRSSRTPWVFWLQDVYSLAMGNEAAARVPVVGRVAAAAFRALERHLLRQSAQVVAITEDFLPILQGWAVAPDRCHVIENWAPLDELPTRPRRNAWSAAHGLDDKLVVLYSGTLGLKHDPALLLALARHYRARPDVRIVVASEGPGAERLAAAGLDNLVVVGFQPFSRFPDVLASADVLAVVLEGAAGAFSVPSKVLSYHCAARPLLASVPAENLAARIVREQRSGLVVGPGDVAGLLAAADRLLDDAPLRAELGRNARDYAERRFDISAIADRFETVLARATRA
jgi:glycosyltransferase involved in cell wall biosynthesis